MQNVFFRMNYTLDISNSERVPLVTKCLPSAFAPAAPSLTAAALHARASLKRSSRSNELVNDEIKINLLPAIEMISCALQGATRGTIRNCFRHAGLHQEGAEVASAVQGDSNIVTLWDEELADTPDALPEKVAFEEF